MDRALADAEKAIEIDPKSSMAYGSRCKIYGELGDKKKAVADCFKSLELDAPYYIKRAVKHILRDLGERVP